MIIFSPSSDLFSVRELMPKSKFLSSIEDWIECNSEQSDMFYFGTIPIPKNMRRKAGTLELENIPQPTNNELFAEEFKARKAEYDADIQSLTLAMAGIILKDGPNESDKKAELQALESATTAEYNNDIAALRTKYYG